MPETNEKIKKLARELSNVENKDIKAPELLRRTFNVPNLSDVLKQDAFNKRNKR